jgi:hypothetical protein
MMSCDAPSMRDHAPSMSCHAPLPFSGEPFSQFSLFFTWSRNFLHEFVLFSARLSKFILATGKFEVYFRNR